MNMYKNSFTLEQIADVVEKSVEEIKAIIEKRVPVRRCWSCSITGPAQKQTRSLTSCLMRQTLTVS